MADEPRAQDWELLDLEPGAGREHIERAYRHRCELYASGTLASYSLYDEDERQWLLEQLKDAYLRVLHSVSVRSDAHNDVEQTVDAPPGPPPDMDEEPGSHLQHHRLARGVSTDQLADETKIRASLLDDLEAENFSDLPAEVYVRGFVVQCAKALGFDDPERLAAAYLAKLKTSIGDGD